MKKIIAAAAAILVISVILAFSLGPAVASASALTAHSEAGRLAIFTGVAVSGMFAHFTKKWLRGEITGDPVAYFVRDYPKRTLAAFATLMGTVVAMFLSNQLVGMEMKPMIMLALTTGYAVDSVANKGEAA